MQDNREYEELIKKLSKRVLAIDEIRDFVDSKYIASVTPTKPDDIHPKKTRYSVKLVDGSSYFIYLK